MRLRDGALRGEVNQEISRLFHKECPDVEEYVNDLIGAKFRYPGVYTPHDLVPKPGPSTAVAIFLGREPTLKDVEFLVGRARRFPGVYERGPKEIVSCSLVKEVTTAESKVYWAPRA